MRNLVVLLSIAAIVLCPYQCAVKWAAAQANRGEAKPACCEECKTHQQTAAEFSEQQTPLAPAPDQEGRACLCAGAVFDAGARSLPDFDAEVLYTTLSLRPGAAHQMALSATAFDHTLLPPPRDGRLTRIALRSLIL